MTTEPTCATTGIKTYNCSVCGAGMGTEELPKATEHTGGTKVVGTKDATCTEEGYTGDTVCNTCGDTIAEGTTIGKTAHNYVGATCNANGVCSICGDTNGPKADTHTPGTPVKEKEVTANCVTEGSYDLVTYCTVCTTEVNRETVTTGTNPSKHATPAEYRYADTGNGTQHYVLYACCGAKVTNRLTGDKVEGHEYDKNTHACKKCGAGCSHPESQKVYVTPSDTNWSEENCQWTCKACGTTSSTPHTPGDWFSSTGMYCEGETFTQTSTCTTCNQKLSREAVGTRPHDYSTVWSKDSANHWHECTLCGAEGSKAAHVYEDYTWDETKKVYVGTCECGATDEQKVIAHTCQWEMVYNEAYHWYKCTVPGCTKTKSLIKHSYYSSNVKNLTWDASSDSFNSLSMTWCCRDCDYEVDWTYQEGSRGTYRVTRNVKQWPCNIGDEVTYSVRVTLPKTETFKSDTFTGPTQEHQYGEPEWSWDFNFGGAIRATATFRCTNKPGWCTNSPTYFALSSLPSGNTVVVTENTATCVEDGKITYTATVVGPDGKTYTNSTTVDAPATGEHNLTKVEAVAATCVATGNIQYWSCETCGQNFLDEDGTEPVADVATEIDPSNHTHAADQLGFDEKHMSKGHYQVCADCGQPMEEPVAHTLTTVVTRAPTCTVQGESKHTCEDCGASWRTYPAADPDNHVKYTWVDNGDGTHSYLCDACGADYGFGNETHKFIDGVCAKCGAACQHTPAEEWSNDGTNHWHECTTCGAVRLNDGAHTYDNWYRNAETNEIEHKCSQCGYIEVFTPTEEYPTPVEHDCDALTELTEVPATCTSTGLTAGTACSICGSIRSGRETIEMLPHVFGEWVRTTTPTYTTLGQDTRYCENCGATETRDVARLTTPAEAPDTLVNSGNGDNEDETLVDIDDQETPLAGMPFALAPEDELTRGLLMFILYWHEGEPETALSSFTDVPETASYAAAIGWGQANGIAIGYGDGRFGPEDTVIRAQMEAILTRYVRYLDLDYIVKLEGDPADEMLWGEAEPILNEFFEAIDALKD